MKQFTIIPIGPYGDTHRERAERLAHQHGYILNIHEVEMGDSTIIDLACGAELLIITPRLPCDILPALGGCRLISLESTGVDCLNLTMAQDAGITVCNVPDYSSDDVAQRIFALILGLTDHLFAGHTTAQKGDWKNPVAHTTTALHGKTLGLFGFGKIGQKVARIAHAFNLNVIAHTAHPDPERAKKYNIEWVNRDTLFAQSDILVLAAPSTPETHHVINANTLQAMKPTAFLINTARGALVDEHALADALKNKTIAGAGIDVFQTEPLPAGHPLTTAPHTILSPHTAYASDRSLDKLHTIALNNIEDFLNGKPKNVIACPD